jgi:hypothetical protein
VRLEPKGRLKKNYEVSSVYTSCISPKIHKDEVKGASRRSNSYQKFQVFLAMVGCVLKVIQFSVRAVGVLNYIDNEFSVFKIVSIYRNLLVIGCV